MKKTEIKIITFALIIFVAYSVVAFALPFTMNGIFWLSYIFSLLAIAVQFPVMKMAFKNGSSVRSKFYGFPIARIGVVYGIVQLISSLLFMLLASILPLWLPLVVYVLLLCISSAGFIAADTMRDEVEHLDRKLEANVKFIRDLQAKANIIASQCNDSDVKKTVANYTEKLRYSDPVSSPELAEVEKELAIYTAELEKAVIDNDKNSALSLCTKLEALLAERNHLCKANKHNN